MDQNYTPITDLVLKLNTNSPPTAAVGKEVEPPKAEVGPAVLHEVSEHKLSEEVKDYITHREETVNVAPDLTSIGVQTTGVPTFSSFNPQKLPLTDDSIIKGLHASVKSSIRWLAETCLYILRQTHVTLKKVHGKITRIPISN